MDLRRLLFFFKDCEPCRPEEADDVYISVKHVKILYSSTFTLDLLMRYKLLNILGIPNTNATNVTCTTSQYNVSQLKQKSTVEKKYIKI